MKTASNFGNAGKSANNDNSVLKEDDEKEFEMSKSLYNIEDMNDLKNKIPKWKDVHDKDNILVFRNFVEMILTTA